MCCVPQSNRQPRVNAGTACRVLRLRYQSQWNSNMMPTGFSRSSVRHARVLAAAAIAAVLSACVVAPPPNYLPPPPPPPNVTVYAYPQQGQSPQQLDRDRYECSSWATQQSGFNPSAPNVPPHERIQVVGGPPPGTGVAVGAVT